MIFMTKSEDGICSTPKCFCYGVLQSNGQYACKKHRIIEDGS